MPGALAPQEAPRPAGWEPGLALSCQGDHAHRGAWRTWVPVPGPKVSSANAPHSQGSKAGFTQQGSRSLSAPRGRIQLPGSRWHRDSRASSGAPAPAHAPEQTCGQASLVALWPGVPLPGHPLGTPRAARCLRTRPPQRVSPQSTTACQQAARTGVFFPASLSCASVWSQPPAATTRKKELSANPVSTGLAASSRDAVPFIRTPLPTAHSPACPSIPDDETPATGKPPCLTAGVGADAPPLGRPGPSHPLAPPGPRLWSTVSTMAIPKLHFLKMRLTVSSSQRDSFSEEADDITVIR